MSKDTVNCTEAAISGCVIEEINGRSLLWDGDT